MGANLFSARDCSQRGEIARIFTLFSYRVKTGVIKTCVIDGKQQRPDGDHVTPGLVVFVERSIAGRLERQARQKSDRGTGARSDPHRRSD